MVAKRLVLCLCVRKEISCLGNHRPFSFKFRESQCLDQIVERGVVSVDGKE